MYQQHNKNDTQTTIAGNLLNMHCWPVNNYHGALQAKNRDILPSKSLYNVCQNFLD